MLRTIFLGTIALSLVFRTAGLGPLMIMKSKGEEGWYMTTIIVVCDERTLRPVSVILTKTQSLSGHKKLQWLFCCDKNKNMVEYILAQPGVVDPVMKDGTSGFLMASARQEKKQSLDRALVCANPTSWLPLAMVVSSRNLGPTFQPIPVNR